MKGLAWYINGVSKFTGKFGGRIMKKISVLAACAMMILVVGCSKDLKVTVKDNLEVEYGDKLDNALLYDKEKSDEGVTVKEVKNFDAKKTGEQEIIVVFGDSEMTKEETIKVTVKDTKKPIIKLKKEKVEITAGDKFDAASNIESVKDPVDGDLKKSEDKKLTKNGYIITSDVNVKKAGSYTVKVTAYDVNGNKAESSYKVTVKKKTQEQNTAQTNTQTSGNSYSNNQGSYNKPATGNMGSNKKPSSGSSNNSGSSSGQTANKPHKHWGPAVEGMYFDSGDELDAWARQYQEHQWFDLGNKEFGRAYGVSECSCGKLFINMFY